MFEISYPQLLAAIAAAWVLVRAAAGIRRGDCSPAREALLLLVFVCIAVIARIVYFPWHHVDGRIGTLKFDASKLIPLRVNLIPFVHMFDRYDGWRMNLLGNVAMFIPVGIVWPICFRRLDSVGKTVAAGAAFTLCIEISQLLFYERSSDVDDVILNTLGAAIGALVCFGCRRLFSENGTVDMQSGGTA